MHAYIGEGNGTPLQYSYLENSMDGEAWWAAVHGVTKSRTWLGDFTFTFHFHALEKEMANYSSVLAWRIPGMENPWWAAICGVAQSWTRLKWLSSSSSSSNSSSRGISKLEADWLVLKSPYELPEARFSLLKDLSLCKGLWWQHFYSLSSIDWRFLVLGSSWRHGFLSGTRTVLSL